MCKWWCHLFDTRIVAVLAFVAVVLAPIVLAPLLNNSRVVNDVELSVFIGGQRPGYNASIHVEASYTASLIRNGTEILRVKRDDDPISLNFYRIIANHLFAVIRSSQPQTWYDINGNARTWIDNCQVAPRMYVAIGTGSCTPSPTRNNMCSMLTSLIVDSTAYFSYSDTGSSHVVTYTRAFTFTASYTITEIGLILEVDVDPSTSTSSLQRVLVAHDLLPQPVQVVANDVLAVTYTISIPYTTQGPFTRNFYHSIINNLLGYRTATGSILSEIRHGGISSTFCYNYISAGCIEFGSSAQTSLPYYVHTPASLIGRVRNTESTFLTYVSSDSQKIRMEFIAGLSFTSAQSVREISYSDFDGAYYWMMLYWALGSAISLGAGDGIRVRIVVELPFGT